MKRLISLFIIVFLCSVNISPAQSEEKLLADIEKSEDIRHWNKPEGKSLEVSQESPLLGSASVKVYPYTYISFSELSGIPGDWSGYDAIAIDFNNTTGKSQPLHILLGDNDWIKAGTQYWDRYNGNHMLPPGRYTFTLGITGLYRGELGSRFNNLKDVINPAQIVRLDLGIGRQGDKGEKPIYLDNIRLISKKLPEFIRAFDFGPEQQNLQLGFTAVTWNTEYSKDKGYGLRQSLGSSRDAIDDGFPSVLYRDWVSMSSSWTDYEFVTDLPNGTYNVFTVYSDCGYWGGQAIRHTKRHIEAEGKIKWSENLGRRGNYWKPNYLFEDVEPLMGQDFWELYMEKIFEPKSFRVKVNDGQLNLKWHADERRSSNVACVIIYPAAKKKEGAEFCNEIVRQQREEFTVAAVEQDLPAGGTLETISQKEKDKGYIFFLTDYEQDTYQTTIPEPEQIKRTKAIYASLDEYEPVTFAVRPLKNLGTAKVEVSDFRSTNTVLSKENFDIRVVRHLSRRGFNQIDYRIIPQILKKFDTVELAEGITREFFVITHIPENTEPGDYTGTIRLKSNNDTIDETINVSLTVYPFTLDESEYVFCFFGTIPDIKVARMLRDFGFNSFSGGSRIELKGFAKDGTPQLDLAGADKYMKMLKRAGYTQEGWGYGGLGITHIRYTKDEGFFGKYERETGLSYVELLRNVFDAVEKHAKEQIWLASVYNLVDETRNVEHAKRQVAQINAIDEASSWVKTGGAFSVSYRKGRNPDNYHQWIFEALDASSLNNHNESVMEQARNMGKEVYIYNQGQSRYSFGAYQWSEFRKGVKGRQQWHLHIQHGFQFFDLDGREPDTGVLYYGQDGPIPTLAFIRCAEGADDFYYCQSLYNRIEKVKNKTGIDSTIVEKAKAVLSKIESGIKINERRKPGWLDNDEFRRACAQAIMELDRAAKK